MIKETKRTIVENLVNIFDTAKLFIFFEIQGMPTEKLRILRTSIAKNNLKMKVFKNTLKKKAIEKSILKDIDINFAGQIAMIWDIENRPMSAKILKEFDKTFINTRVKSGIHNGKIITSSYVKKLSVLPSLDVLRMNLLYMISSVTRKLLFSIKYKSIVIIKIIKQKFNKE